MPDPCPCLHQLPAVESATRSWLKTGGLSWLTAFEAEEWRSWVTSFVLIPPSLILHALQEYRGTRILESLKGEINGQARGCLLVRSPLERISETQPASYEGQTEVPRQGKGPLLSSI